MKPISLSLLVIMICIMGYTESAAVAGDIEGVFQKLERNLAEIESIKADFVQTRAMRMFKHDTRLTGKILMKKPDRFLWRTETPVGQTMYLEGQTLYQWNNDTDKVERMNLEAAPVLDALMTQMRLWFYGPYTALLEDYTVTLLEKTPLRLMFKPVEGSHIASALKTVVIEFEPGGKVLRSVKVYEKNGDETSYLFEKTQLNVEIEPEMWEVRPV